MKCNLKVQRGFLFFFFLSRSLGNSFRLDAQLSDRPISNRYGTKPIPFGKSVSAGRAGQNVVTTHAGL